MADRDLNEHRLLIARILSRIPTHEESPQSVTEIASRVVQDFDRLPAEHIASVTNTIIVVLDTFSLLVRHDTRYRCRGEMPTYFLRSYAWYVANAQALVNNWTRSGVGDDIAISALLDSAPYLLKIAEDRRLGLAGPEVEPVRTRRVACVLVKTVVNRRPYFLFEWDREAAQYQLIGGRIQEDEKPETAAAHELTEEVAVEPGRRLESGRQFEIHALDWNRSPPLHWTGVSRTVGALTRYEVWTYGVLLKVDQLMLREHCRWLSIDEMLHGKTESGRRTGDPVLYEMINAHLVGGLAAVPNSIGSEDIPSFQDSSELARDGRTSVFIGHGRSSAWRKLAEHLRDRHGYHVVTYESEQQAGYTTTDLLRHLIDRAAFAIMVHTAEDEQAGGGLRARQNVVHETGLFQGRLGFTKAIIVRQRGCDAFSNLAGLHELHYTDDIREAFGDIVAAVQRELGSQR